MCTCDLGSILSLGGGQSESRGAFQVPMATTNRNLPHLTRPNEKLTYRRRRTHGHLEIVFVG